MTDEELNKAYYQLYHLCVGSNTIKEFHKITFIPKKDVKSCLAKQALWQVHTPKKIGYPHYKVIKPNK